MRVLLTFLVATLIAFPAAAATQIFTENWEGSTPLSTHWDSPTNCKAVSISSSQSVSPTRSALYTPFGSDTSGNCNHALSMTSFYLSYRIYISPSFNGVERSGQHLWRFYTTDGTHQFDTGIYGDDSATIRFGIDVLLGGYSPTSGESPSTGPHKHALNLQKGAWNRIEVLFTMGTAGGNDGGLMIWYTNGSGTVTPWPGNGGATETGKSWIGSGQGTRTFNKFSVVTNYDTATSNEFWYVDDVEIWDGCPSAPGYCGVASSGTPGPATVTGVVFSGVTAH